MTRPLLSNPSLLLRLTSLGLFTYITAATLTHTCSENYKYFYSYVRTFYYSHRFIDYQTTCVGKYLIHCCSCVPDSQNWAQLTFSRNLNHSINHSWDFNRLKATLWTQIPHRVFFKYIQIKHKIPECPYPDTYCFTGVFVKTKCYYRIFKFSYWND